MNIALDRLRECLSYDSTTGRFTWLKVFRGVTLGATAGSSDARGAVFIRVDGGRYPAHRLAWFYVNGVWPAFEIDHINGDPSDNRIANLRDVPHRTNQQNFKAAFKTNASSGLLGVSLHKASGLYRARITAGQERCLGYFKTPDEAHAAYLAAKRMLHDGCTI